MKEFAKFIILYLCVFIPEDQILSQSLTLALIHPSDYSLKSTDLWNLTLNNPGQVPYEGILRATIHENIDGMVVEAQSRQFVTSPGNTSFNSRNYQQLEPVKVLYSNPRYQTAFERTNALPAGDYEVCVSFVNTVDNQIAKAGEVIATSCYNIMVQPFSPPNLISPFDLDTVCAEFPFFIWSPPSPLRFDLNVQYRLIMVEILGNQSAYAAMNANPEWLVKDRITQPLFQYLKEFRTLREGGRYAWRVAAIGNGQEIGESEIWEFVYSCGKKEEEEAVPDENSETKKTSIAMFYDLADPGNAPNYTIDSLKVPFMLYYTGNSRQVRCQILDQLRISIYETKMDLLPGYNFNILDLTPAGNLANGEPYFLVVENEFGETKELIFRYEIK